MHSQVVVVARPNRLPLIESHGGLAGRQTAPDTVHLVSAAATPLGGDTMAVRVVVEPGARLRLRSVAASIVLPAKRSGRSYAEFVLDIGGEVDIDLEPTIVAADASHVSTITAAVSECAELRVRERVQIGRSGERQGFWSGAMVIDACGKPVLRHRTELGCGAVADDVLSTPRATISELRYPQTCFADAATAPEGAVHLALAAGGVLSTWQGEVLPA